MRKALSPVLASLMFCVQLFAQVVGDYRTSAGGAWSTVGIWQTWNGTAWVAAGASPTSTNGVITIQSGHMVNITAGPLTLDQVVVNGTLNLKNIALTFANGAGDDMIVNGSFEDSSNTTVVFNAGAAWSIAAGATFIRCGAGGSNIWQTSYSGGIAVIPSTANWIVRKSGTSNPSVTTIGAVYPNLTIENKTAAAWITTTGSTFNGGGAPNIKGNFDIGGTQTGTVDFLSNTSAAGCVLVNGNFTIRSGSIYRNFGTGLEVQGNVTITGDLHHVGGTGARKLIFSGSATQTVSGAGYMNIYALEVNKSGGTVNLSRTIYIDNAATFTAGTITSSSTNPVVFDNNATVSAIAATSFVNGPVVKYDNGASGNFTYPVGKNSDYQALAISGAAETAFWTEAFSNGCASGCSVSTYTGPNGTWTETSTGTNDATNNPWYVSYAEDGNGVGVCGSATNSDPSLHVGSNSIGDAGAAYDAGGVCGFFYCVTTNLRAESPIINCTGRSNMLLTFNYIEYGGGTNDNATLWYYNGATWSQLVDIPKSYCCGGINCNGSLQGLWVNYRIALPASANNNPNVKIGFNWTNNDDGVGTDPSFAVDDISIADNKWTAEYFYANPQVVYNNNLAPTLAQIDGCEYWTLDRNASSGTKTLTLTWDANSCPTIYALSDTRVAHYDQITTNIWQDEGNGANTGTTAAGTVRSAAAVTYFSPFTIGLIPNPLPIEIISFEGSCNVDAVDLSWSTASETDNDVFIIEHSADGNSFTECGRVFGAGTSSTVHHYQFRDAHAMKGVNYYRLKQVDLNGRSENFGPVSVNADECSNSGLQLDNTWMSNGELSIAYSGASANVVAEVFSADGKLISRKEVANGETLTMTSAEWPAGIYFIRITDGFSSDSRNVVK